jgi:hypothetical protein
MLDGVVQPLVARPEFEAQDFRQGQVMTIVGLRAVELFSQFPGFLVQAIGVKQSHAEKVKSLKNQ